ncbi:MAG: haloalkane dehalogenase [Pseudomonadota bacterium]
MATLDALRTPDDRFEGLPDWPYAPNYLETGDGLRMHYVDEGAGGPTFLCLHGQPSWSYLYRKMIPVFTARGGRVLAPDLIGFGRSDKPTDEAVYTFDFHRRSLVNFVNQFDLSDICLVVQDWGGLLGLTLPVDFADRITRLIVMNTALGVGTNPGEGFLAWKAYAASQPDLDIAQLMKRSSPILSDAEAGAYAAPFPDKSYKAGVRQFPEIVPISPEMGGVEVSKKAARFWAEDWSGESFMAIGVQDPVLGPPAMEKLRALIRNCPEPMRIEEGGHFVQEWGGPVAEAACDAFGL